MTKLSFGSIVGSIASIGVTIDQAQQIGSTVLSLMVLAEQAFEKAQGPAKLAAVLAGLDGLLPQLNLTAEATKIKARLVPVINFLVSVFNFFGSWATILDDLLPKVAAAVNPGTPTSQPQPEN